MAKEVIQGQFGGGPVTTKDEITKQDTDIIDGLLARGELFVLILDPANFKTNASQATGGADDIRSANQRELLARRLIRQVDDFISHLLSEEVITEADRRETLPTKKEDGKPDEKKEHRKGESNSNERRK